MTVPLRRSPHPDGSSTRADKAITAVRRDELLARAAALPGTWAGRKPEWDIPAASVGLRLSLLLVPHTDGRFLINVELDPENIVAVWATFRRVEPDFHQSRRHWVSIDPTSPDYQADETTAMVEDPYRLVLSLPTRRMYGAILLVDAAGSSARLTWQW